MDINKVWDVLGIQETKNEEEIIKAYRDKLVYVNPEDDAEGFMQLRNAYEMAIRYVHQPAQEEDMQDKNDVDLWIDKVSAVYSSLEKRRTLKLWEELLKDDICTSLDTNTEAREKLLIYLMDNHYLPWDVWKLIEREFDIIADKEQLYESFPRNYIDYVVGQITIGGFLDFSMFTTKEGEVADEYINTYFKLKSDIDENRLDDCQKIFEDLERYDTYHPYKDVEKARYYLLTDRLDKAADLAESIMTWYPDDSYITCVYAKVKSGQKDYDTAIDLYKQVLSKFPDYYIAKVGLMESLFEGKNYTEAKEIAIELLNQYHQNDIARKYMVESNEILIQEYKDKIKVNEDHKTKLELAWCLYQNESFEECIGLLEEIPVDVRDDYDFINLYGRVYLAASKFDQALVKLKVWLDAILNTPKDDSEESKVRYNRLGYAYYSIGLCYMNLEDYDNAVIYYQKSIEVEDKISEKLVSMERMAYTYLKAEKFQECVKICEEIIGISKEYYPAYLYRQEAFFELENDQEVINDYHRAVEIYPGYIRPYILAMKVFIRHNQLQDAKEIADAAKKAGLDSNEFKLLCIKITRLKTNEKDERHEAIQQCIQLKKLLKAEDNDIKEPVSIDFEMAMLHVQNNEYEKAIAIMDSIIKEKPSEDYYMYIKGMLFKDIRKYQSAIILFKELLRRNSDKEMLYYEIGCCYFELDQMEKALEYYEKFVEISPDHSDAYDANDKIVDIYRDLIKKTKKPAYYEKALPYADRLVEIGQNAYAYTCRGLLHLDVFEFEKALSDFHTALDISPNEWAVLNNTGLAYMFMRNMDQAVWELRKSTEQITVDRTQLPYSNLAKSYFIMRNYDEALKHYKMLYELDPTSDDYIDFIADIYKAKGDMQNCLLWTNKLRDAGYYESAVESSIGDIYFHYGDIKKADKHYKKSLTLDRLRTYVDYAYFLLFTQNYSSSISCIKKLIKHVDVNDEYYIDACRYAADIYWGIKTYSKRLSRRHKISYEKEAQNYANLSLQAIHKFYGSIEAFFEYPRNRAKQLVNLAYLYLFMGDEQKAEYYVQKALESPICNICRHEKCVDAYEVLGMIHEAKDQLDKAKEYYEIATYYDPCYLTCSKRLENVIEKLKG